MNIAELAIRKATLAWTLCVAVLTLGWLAFLDLPRREHAELPIRETRVITPYPGASAAQVESEVSNKIEMAARGLPQIQRTESFSARGLSVVSVVAQDEYDQRELPRIWDALRNSIAAMQPDLPPGAAPPMIDNDFGLIYDIYYAVVGDGFTEAELKRIGALLQRGLSTVEGVAKVSLFGERQEAIFVEVSEARAKALGIDRVQISEALGDKNLPTDAGRIRVGPEQVPIVPTPLFRSERDLGDLLIAGDRDRLIRLGDIAEIRRDYRDPHRLLRIDGRPAVGIAVSSRAGSDPIAIGAAVQRRVAELTAEIPLGAKPQVIAMRSQAVAATVGGLIDSLVLTAAIVTLALLLFMGLRSALVVGFATLLTLAGTFLVMDYFQIPLERVSLSALIIAIALIPGPAILVVDSMKTHMSRGLPGIAAAREAVGRNALPLLAATTVTILAFAPIGSMRNTAGEYLRSLFPVMLIALSIGLASAMTAAPLLANRCLRLREAGDEKPKTPRGPCYRRYDRTLMAVIAYRRTFLGATALLLALTLYSVGRVKQIHFPATEASHFLVEVHFREGTHIDHTERQMTEIQTYLRDLAGVTLVVTAIGDGHPRHLLGYEPEPHPGSNYAAALVFVDHPQRLEEIASAIQADLETRHPDASVKVTGRIHTPSLAGRPIQLRVSGPDPSELRRIGERVKALIASDPEATAVRDDWGAKIKVARPVLAEDVARRLHIDRARIAAALRTTFSGTVGGFYGEEGGTTIPIIVQAPKEERDAVDNMADIQVTSPLRGDRVSMQRLADRITTSSEDARRTRRDGTPVITIHADTPPDSTQAFLARIKPRVEQALNVDLVAQGPWRGLALGVDANPLGPGDKIALKDKPGYFIAWGGEEESGAEFRAGLRASVPLCCGLILLVLIALFNGLRQPLIALLVVPPSMIGVTAGLLLTGQPFDFMALLGVIGLSGILIGNAILLLNRIDLELGAGNAATAAIRQAASACLRPAGITTGIALLGMLPLLQHTFFLSMAVSIISGLGLGTLVMLVLVPVLRATLFRIGSNETT